jgi:hypothetical protein
VPCPSVSIPCPSLEVFCCVEWAKEQSCIGVGAKFWWLFVLHFVSTTTKTQKAQPMGKPHSNSWDLLNNGTTSKKVMEQHALKSGHNCLNTNIYSYQETCGGQSSNLYLNVVTFSTPVLIRHLRQLKTVVFLHWCLISVALLLSCYFQQNILCSFWVLLCWGHYALATCIFDMTFNCLCL